MNWNTFTKIKIWKSRTLVWWWGCVCLVKYHKTRIKTSLKPNEYLNQHINWGRVYNFPPILCTPHSRQNNINIISTQSQGSQGYVVNMDAQIILSNNIVTFFSISKLPSSGGSLKSFIRISKAYGLNRQ